MTNFHIFSGTRLYQTHIFVKRITCIFNNLCAVQDESVQAGWLSVSSTGRGCAAQSEGNSLLCILQPELHPLSLYYDTISVSVKAQLLKLHWPR